MGRRSFGLALFLAGIFTWVYLNHPMPCGLIEEGRLPGEVLFSPLASGSRVVVVTPGLLWSIDHQGKVVASASIAGIPRFPPICLDNQVCLVDRENSLSGYSFDSLATSASMVLSRPPTLPPVSAHGYLVIAASQTLEVFSSSPLQKVGEFVASGSICGVFPAQPGQWYVFHSPSPESPVSYSLILVSFPEGKILWSAESLAMRPPCSTASGTFFQTVKGQPFLHDLTGTCSPFHWSEEGFSLADVTLTRIFLLAAMDSRLESYPLATGPAWSITVPTPILQMPLCPPSVVIICRENIEAFHMTTGSSNWHARLGSGHTGGGKIAEDVWVSYRDKLFRNTQYCSRLSHATGKIRWTTWTGEQGFWPPVSLGTCDILFEKCGAFQVIKEAP